ncbi:ABC transporter substrate-binding protein [Salipaludibacillus sp. CF4.18]|uniref:ABC transporter substrate-binding protein n=1 Tax=Salipaludibacillus sp. CF4.18 TaxID=3373081 RepID=UPI003EE6F410
MNFRFKRVLSVVMGIGLVSGIVGCGDEESVNGDNNSNSNNISNEASENSDETSTNSDEVTEISYFSFSATPNYEEELEQIVDAFEGEYPNIKVNLELAAYDDYFTRLQTQIAGSNAPDVFELNYENFVQYASRGTLADLSEYIESDEDFDPNVLNQEAFNAYNYEGKQYGMVESFSNVLTFYNKDLFDEAGVDYPSSEWTWDDELQAAIELTDKESNVWGTYAPVTMNEFYKIAAQNGGQIFNEDGSVAINSPENLEALNYMVDKIVEHEVSPSPADLSGQSPEDLFMNGQLAVLHTGIWMFGAFEEASFDWDIELEAGNTQKAHHFFANGLAVSADSDQQEAAYKFARFMSASEEVANIRIDSSWELPALSDDDILSPYLEQSSPENREAVFEALNSLILPPVVENWSRISDVTNEALESVQFGESSPEEVLNDLEEEFNKILEE